MMLLPYPPLVGVVVFLVVEIKAMIQEEGMATVVITSIVSIVAKIIIDLIGIRIHLKNPTS